jgi:hypothetical protein
VDAALAGDEVLVSNGVYATGVRVTPGYAALNRVCVTQIITLASLSGPAATLIVGAADPITGGCGNNAVRGVYMQAGRIIGFTISNCFNRISGHNLYDACGGGLFSYGYPLGISNCTVIACTASQFGGGIYASGGTADVCVIRGCSAMYGSGGGAAAATLNTTTLEGNAAGGNGGGAHMCALRGCMLAGNRAGMSGGGAFGGNGAQCIIAGNVAQMYGGGVAGDNYTPASFDACVITGNVAGLYGGGMYRAGVANSALCGNRSWYGGGSVYGSLANCTVGGNQAVYGGGTMNGNIYNSIVSGNEGSAGENCFLPSEIRYSCTTPYQWGTGNISNDPHLASAWHVANTTPCGGKGSSTYAGGTDIDGEVWGTPPTIGCDEYRSGSITGAIRVAIVADTVQPPRGYRMRVMADIAGRLTMSAWTFDDGVCVTNEPWQRHAWQTLGPHTITLRAYNETYPAGVATSLVVTVIDQPVHYADAGNLAGAAWPYTSWATAASNLQDAVDAAAPGALVLAADGVYARGGRAAPQALATNRVVILHDMTVRSVNGPAAAMILGAPDPATGDLGDRAVRGVWMNAGTLCGFTISNGHTATSGNDYLDRSGGGVAAFGTAPLISNCVIVGCGSAAYGGGILWGTSHACHILNNHTGWGSGGSYNGSGGGSAQGVRYGCVLRDNVSLLYGGGAFGGTLDACVLQGNASDWGPGGGGAANATLTACVIISNRMDDGSGGGAYSCTLNACTVLLNHAGSGGGLGYMSTANACVIMSNDASVGGGADFSTLNWCMVTDNTASNYGGGTSQGTINLCVITGNRAMDGGGTWNGTINNCLITGNTATRRGGGAYCGSYQYINSCTLSGNTAAEGNGLYITNGFVRNSIAYFNGATNWAGYGSALCSCTVPLVPWPGNISNDPEFVNGATGNYRLAESSPCINAGTNTYVTWNTDLDGNPRVYGSRVDMGAYEFVPEPGCAAALSIAGILLAITRAHGRWPPIASGGARISARRIA